MYRSSDRRDTRLADGRFTTGSASFSSLDKLSSVWFPGDRIRRFSALKALCSANAFLCAMRSSCNLSTSFSRNIFKLLRDLALSSSVCGPSDGSFCSWIAWRRDDLRTSSSLEEIYKKCQKLWIKYKNLCTHFILLSLSLSRNNFGIFGKKFSVNSWYKACSFLLRECSNLAAKLFQSSSVKQIACQIDFFPSIESVLFRLPFPLTLWKSSRYNRVPKKYQ